MKRFKKVILTSLFSLIFCSCQPSKNRLADWMKEDGKIKILATTAQIGDLVEKIGGEQIDVLVLIQGDLDPHSYEIVKGDAEKLQRADLIFYNGLGLEHGAGLSSYLRSCGKAVAIGEKISAGYPENILQKEGIVDPHLWLDISLWQKGVAPMVDAISRLDPNQSSFYAQRGASLIEAMQTTHEELLSQMQQIPKEKRYLVTSHDAFQYFARAYLAEPNEADWLERFTAPEGLAPEGQLNSRDIQKIIEYLSAKKISVLFPESNVSRDSIRKIASVGKEIGLNVQISQEPLYGDSMGGLSYLEMMRANASIIVKHLKPSGE